MKKDFEDPAFEYVQISTEAIADVPGGDMGETSYPDSWD